MKLGLRLLHRRRWLCWLLWRALRLLLRLMHE
jgi:hypothetical protein